MNCRLRIPNLTWQSTRLVDSMPPNRPRQLDHSHRLDTLRLHRSRWSSQQNPLFDRASIGRRRQGVKGSTRNLWKTRFLIAQQHFFDSSVRAWLITPLRCKFERADRNPPPTSLRQTNLRPFRSIRTVNEKIFNSHSEPCFRLFHRSHNRGDVFPVPLFLDPYFKRGYFIGQHEGCCSIMKPAISSWELFSAKKKPTAPYPRSDTWDSQAIADIIYAQLNFTLPQEYQRCGYPYPLSRCVDGGVSHYPVHHHRWCLYFLPLRP